MTNKIFLIVVVGLLLIGCVSCVRTSSTNGETISKNKEIEYSNPTYSNGSQIDWKRAEEKRRGRWEGYLNDN